MLLGLLPPSAGHVRLFGREPTSGVSPLVRRRLWNVIREEADRGAGVLVSTHYMDEAEYAT